MELLAGTLSWLFGPGILWIGFRMTLSRLDARILQMSSWGVSPPRILGRRAKSWDDMKPARLLRSWLWSS